MWNLSFKFMESVFFLFFFFFISSFFHKNKVGGSYNKLSGFGDWNKIPKHLTEKKER